MSIDSRVSKKTKIPSIVERTKAVKEGTTPLSARTSRTFFEILFDYNISDAPTNNYTVESYFFIPRALKINPQTYSKTDFYEDLENYIRFKTPQIALSGIINPGNSFSPLYRIKAPLNEILNGNQDPALQEKAIYELKMLGNLVRSNTRDEISQIIRFFHEKGQKQEICKTNAWKLLENLNKFWEMYDDLEDAIYTSQIPAPVRETYDIVKDYMSYMIEKYLTRLFMSFKKGKSPETCSEILLQISKRVKAEQTSRKERQSKLVFRDKNENESFSYWLSLYKKYISSVFFMNMSEKNLRFRWLNLGYAIAAGSAMGVTVWLTFFAQNLQISTVALFGLIVIIYILKDRMKELLRLSSDRMLVRYFPDRKFKIIDVVSGEDIGMCRETVKFIQSAPFEIQNLRDIGARTEIEREMKPEFVLRYKKRITLFTQKILETHSRQRNVHDILRFSIRKFLTFADKAYAVRRLLDPENQSVKAVYPAKVYHMSVVQKMTAHTPDGVPIVHLQRFRVIFDKNGVKRVEKVEA